MLNRAMLQDIRISHLFTYCHACLVCGTFVRVLYADAGMSVLLQEWQSWHIKHCEDDRSGWRAVTVFNVYAV